MPIYFGAKLNYLRRKRRLTQAAVAQQLQLSSRAYLSNLEVERQAPSLDLVVRVAAFFDVTTDYLLRDNIDVEDVQLRPIHHSDQESLMKLLGEKIRRLRFQHDQTQRDVAQLLGLRTHSQISHIESGRHEPSIEIILRLADIFDVSIDYLLDDRVPIDSTKTVD
jgi:transcriptional regulator with XRE-family HTH domain